jgi:hypothetical protein
MWRVFYILCSCVSCSYGVYQTYHPVLSPTTLTWKAEQVVVDYRYAFFKNAQTCYCNSSYGRYSPAECVKSCETNKSESCEGSLSNAVLDTGWMSMFKFLSPCYNPFTVMWCVCVGDLEKMVKWFEVGWEREAWWRMDVGEMNENSMKFEFVIYFCTLYY